MLTFTPNFGRQRPPRVLFLGAHSDDIEIGCGGAVLRLIAEYKGFQARWVVFGATPKRAEEARRSAAEFLAGTGASQVEIHDFPDAYFPSRTADIKTRFEALKPFEPDLIFTHCRHDLHQDHALLNQLAWNTFRDHAVLEYEVPKYDGDLGCPNFFIPVPAETAKKKASLLVRHFATQANKHWFDEQLFLGLMRVRGVECRSPSGYAEGFYARKVIV